MSPVATQTLVDRKPFFDTEHLKAELAGQGGRFLIQMVSTVVLARLLTPADFGLIAMVTAVTGFASLFKDLGLSMATVQKAEVTHEQVSVLFWVNVAISVLIALITAALAPVIAWFYGDPRLTAVGMALSLAFVFGGLTVQHQALLRRQMRFTALAIIPIVAMVAAVMAAIISATLGAGYWALVIMYSGRGVLGPGHHGTDAFGYQRGGRLAGLSLVARPPDPWSRRPGHVALWREFDGVQHIELLCTESGQCPHWPGLGRWGPGALRQGLWPADASHSANQCASFCSGNSCPEQTAE